MAWPAELVPFSRGSEQSPPFSSSSFLFSPGSSSLDHQMSQPVFWKASGSPRVATSMQAHSPATKRRVTASLACSSLLLAFSLVRQSSVSFPVASTPGCKNCAVESRTSLKVATRSSSGATQNCRASFQNSLRRTAVMRATSLSFSAPTMLLRSPMR